MDYNPHLFNLEHHGFMTNKFEDKIVQDIFYIYHEKL